MNNESYFPIEDPKDHNITVHELKELCDKYDKSEGEYPESRFEGRAVIMFILKELGIVEDEWDWEGFIRVFNLVANDEEWRKP